MVYLAGGGAQTNNTPRVNPAGNARPPPLGGISGLGFPGFEDMLGSTPDPNSINQFMQNPAVSQMMQSLLSNPQYMNQVLFQFLLLSLRPKLTFTFPFGMSLIKNLPFVSGTSQTKSHTFKIHLPYFSITKQVLFLIVRLCGN